MWFQMHSNASVGLETTSNADVACNVLIQADVASMVFLLSVAHFPRQHRLHRDSHKPRLPEIYKTIIDQEEMSQNWAHNGVYKPMSPTREQQNNIMKNKQSNIQMSQTIFSHQTIWDVTKPPLLNCLSPSNGKR